MANRFTLRASISFRSFSFALILLILGITSNAGAQCNNIETISFTPLDTITCESPFTVGFQSGAVVDTTPVLLSMALSSPNFQSFFTHSFPTQNNGCYYFLEIAGMFTIWGNSPGYYDAFGFFNVDFNEFISEGVIDNFFFTPPLFLEPNTFNPDHVYRYYYAGNGGTVNIGFSDFGQYSDNSGAMLFRWYVIPCFEYHWDFGDNTTSSELNPTHTFSSPGTYEVTLTVTDNLNDCSESFSSTVTINSPPEVDLGSDALICSNESLLLDATTPNAQYQWQDGSTSPTIEATQGGIFWVDVTVNGCTSRDSIQIEVLDDIITDVSTTICPGDVFMIGNESYSEPGFYSGTLTSALGCDSIVNLDLSVIEVYAVINEPLSIDCNISVISLDGNGSSSGPNYSYLWLTQNGNILSGADTPNPEVDGAGIYQLIVTYDDGTNICVATETVTVLENTQAPLADAGPMQTLNCWLPVLTLDGTNSDSDPEFSYHWSTVDGNIVADTTTLTPLVDQPGTYMLLVTNLENGCTATDFVEVGESVFSIEDFEVSFESPSCFGNDGFIAIEPLLGNNSFLYSIDGGETYFPDPVFNFLSPGNYIISIKDTFDCEVSQDFFLPVPSLMDIQLEEEVTIQAGQSYDLEAQVNIPDDQIASILWTPARGLSCDQCLDPVASPTETTAYTITVTDLDGCEAQASVLIHVRNSSTAVYIPNVFTPTNRDGNNDVFRIYTATEQVRQIRQLRIFNRWGAVVFEANGVLPDDSHAAWDGTYQGKDIQGGVFIYYIEIEFIDGRVIPYKGDVTVID